MRLDAGKRRNLLSADGLGGEGDPDASHGARARRRRHFGNRRLGATAQGDSYDAGARLYRGVDHTRRRCEPDDGPIDDKRPLPVTYLGEQRRGRLPVRGDDLGVRSEEDHLRFARQTLSQARGVRDHQEHEQAKEQRDAANGSHALTSQGKHQRARHGCKASQVPPAESPRGSATPTRRAHSEGCLTIHSPCLHPAPSPQPNRTSGSSRPALLPTHRPPWGPPCPIHTPTNAEGAGLSTGPPGYSTHGRLF